MKQLLKIQCDLSGKGLVVYNKDRSYFNEIGDKSIAGYLIKQLGLGPMQKVYAKGEIHDGEFRITEIVDENPGW